MRNPLNRRIKRDLLKEWKRYLVLFLLMSVMIAVASGIFVANDSMMAAIDESYDKYNIEEGHFVLKKKATDNLLDKMDEKIDIYEQFYKDVPEINDDSDDCKIRVYRLRTDINKLCIIDGKMPTNDGEIAIDRMHADNHNIKIGDTITAKGKEFKVTALIAASDYSCLFENNSDMLFSAVRFNVGFVTDEGYDRVEASETYSYVYKYKNTPKDETEEKEVSDKLIEECAVLAATGGYTSDMKEAEALADDPVKVISLQAEYGKDVNELVDFVPQYANQAITFAETDMGSDQAMMEVLVYIFIAVLAFVFAITTSNTIQKEAAVIGTLRATGYTRGELLRHYLLMPVIVTVVSAVVGNVLGYTIFKDAMVGMYYNSYSLVTYETIWNPKAFVVTTVVPLILMFIVNFVVIFRLLRISPLKFLRKDLSTSKRKKAIRLPSWKFLNRFRLRNLFNNLGGYIVLLFGLGFVMMLLAFSIGMPDTMDKLKADVENNLISNYQYILKDYKDGDKIIETSESTAEKVSMTELYTTEGVRVGESITVYGAVDNSRYINIGSDLKDNEVKVSEPFRKKFGLKEGDKLVLKEKYSDTTYEFIVKDSIELDSSLSIFMPLDNYNKVLGNEEGSFMGFLSTNEITDIKDEFIYKVITVSDLKGLGQQIDHSMGNYMDYLSIANLIMAVLVIYLLTKIIIEKNANSISMIKVLGYENKEINSIYIRLTTVVVVVFAIINSFVGVAGIKIVTKIAMYSMNGWFDLYFSPISYVKMIVLTVGAYLIVALFDMQRIKKIPLADALKNVE